MLERSNILIYKGFLVAQHPIVVGGIIVDLAEVLRSPSDNSHEVFNPTTHPAPNAKPGTFNFEHRGVNVYWIDASKGERHDTARVVIQREGQDDEALFVQIDMVRVYNAKPIDYEYLSKNWKGIGGRRQWAQWLADKIAEDSDQGEVLRRHLARRSLANHWKPGERCHSKDKDSIKLLAQHIQRKAQIIKAKTFDNNINQLDDAFHQYLNVLESIGDYSKGIVKERRNALEKGSENPNNVEVLCSAHWIRLDDKGNLVCPWALYLGQCLWVDVVKDKIRSKAAITVATYEDAILKSYTARQLHIPFAGEEHIIRDNDGRQIGHIVNTIDKDVIKAVQAGLKKLGSVTAQRLIKYFVLGVHDQFQQGLPGSHVLLFDGGFDALREKINGRKGGGVVRQIKNILEAGQHIYWKGDNGDVIAGLWTYSYRRGNRKASGEVRVTVGDSLAPGLVHSLPGRTPSQRRRRRLIPELRFEPPVGVVRHNEQGAVWALHRLILLEMVTRCDELAADDGIIIQTPKWEALARRARLPTNNLNKVIESWVEGESDQAPALIERQGDLFTLAHPHQPELRFIVDNGIKVIEGRRRGKKSSRSRRRR